MTLVSVAAMSVAAAPVSAAQPGAGIVAEPTITIQCSNSWKSAGGVPGRWSTVRDRNCSIFGHQGYRIAYQWRAERGRPCIKVKGFVNGRAKWYNAGCGRSGNIQNVPWGNVAANKEIKVKGASLFKWR
ncbi:hypothetical protein [Streptomyces flavidovirens]|uniref:hypothetical protein n=1 Tax=Streptomyces flavidovirens TaxID=67298 RepID=UPI0036B389C0